MDSTKASALPDEKSRKETKSRDAPKANGQMKGAGTKSKSYASEGVQDNDPFSLPGSDWQLLFVLIIVAAAVRLFRIYQPSSVVFDEVQ